MPLFSKPPQEPVKNPEIEEIRTEIGIIKTQITTANEDMQKQISDVCSALTVLDDELVAVKERKDFSSIQNEIQEMKAAVESLALIGRLCLQNKADVEVLAKKVEALEKKESIIRGPAKILN